MLCGTYLHIKRQYEDCARAVAPTEGPQLIHEISCERGVRVAPAQRGHVGLCRAVPATWRAVHSQLTGAPPGCEGREGTGREPALRAVGVQSQPPVGVRLVLDLHHRA